MTRTKKNHCQLQHPWKPCESQLVWIP
jgi:hypothetical protein